MHVFSPALEVFTSVNKNIFRGPLVGKTSCLMKIFGRHLPIILVDFVSIKIKQYFS